VLPQVRQQPSVVIPSTPGLPLFFLTRFSAAFRFGRDRTRSIRPSLSLPGCPLPFAAVGSSTLPPSLGASPLPMNGSSNCLAICGMDLSRLERASPSFTFGPSLPASRQLLRPRLTPRSAGCPASPFRTLSEVSPGKNITLRRATARFTPPGSWPPRLRDHLLARPARRRLVSGSCPSARDFVPRFLPTVGRLSAVAVRFACDGLLAGGLTPPR
jgi:hypothetical protein